MRSDDILTWSILVLFAGMAAFIAASVPVHHDIAWPLWVAERVLGGAELYVDVIEVHPPLIVGVAMLGALLGRLPLLDPVSGYHLITFAVVACSLVVCWRLLGHLVSAATRRALVLVAGFLLLPFVGYSFGQEEHLMLALALPYLLMLGALADDEHLSQHSRWLIGIMGGLGISMKPFFGPLWLALVGYLVWRRGVRRLLAAEVLAPALVISGYIAVTAIFTPAYFDVAFIAARVYPHFFPVPFQAILFSIGTAAVILALLIDHVIVVPGQLRGVRHIMLIALGGFFLAVLLQQKGWSYHWYPVYAAALLLVTVTLSTRLNAHVAQPSAINGTVLRWGRVSAVALLLVLSAWRVTWTRSFWGDLSGSPFHLPQLSAVVERFAAGGPIAALSVGMPVAFPLVTYTAVSWSPRFSCLWMLPGLYADVWPGAGGFDYAPAADLNALDRYVVESVTADLVRDRPTLIIVDKAPPVPRLQGFDYLEYFGRHPEFRSLMSEYVRIGDLGRYDIYRSTRTSAASSTP